MTIKEAVAAAIAEWKQDPETWMDIDDFRSFVDQLVDEAFAEAKDDEE